MKIIKSKSLEIFDIELEKDLLAKNKNLARKNRRGRKKCFRDSKEK